jgi:hypothetical protein
MKIRAILAALIITVAMTSSANATIAPVGIGPEGTKLRSEIIEKGFAPYFCTLKNISV